MSVTPDALAQRFVEHRPHLLAVGYRLTGSIADAEDAVQEAWLRLAGLGADAATEITNLPAWLTTVVSHLCLDRLRSAAARRETYPGPWLPEPVVTSLDAAGADPLERLVHDDDVRLAVLVVLDTLSPEQRVAYVLHDAFGVPFADVAATLGCTVAAARQHASRGRRRLAEAGPAPRTVPAAQQQLVGELFAALATGDVPAVTALLHPDVALTGDGGGRARTALKVVVGAEKVARFLLGLVHKYGYDQARAVPVLVNGELGLVLPADPGDAEHAATGTHVVTLDVRDGVITAIYDVANPDKLRHLPA
ncbi:sigma-70 family RNA polymerase sigma factor [Rhodococcus sp. X156]|uniref:sigma-70 family RNA polymerase sigma factor n=1 Tax=Rhodococcus sp. X156 TaxID=2499145 RepID=UPI000FDC11A4|nr:sigma-70 family RNA polymerase sigma factor [Rhodococcus sp. X156]